MADLEWLLFLKHDSTYKVLVPFICTSYDQLETEKQQLFICATN